MSAAYAQLIEATATGNANADETFLGPARVVGLAGTTPLVEIDQAEVRAELALAYPYQPQPGDELLVIGKQGRYYVIGVLHATGEVALRFLGDVRLHAVAGKLELAGDEGVRVRGKAIELGARKLQVLADSVVQRANSWYQQVRETFDVHAGEKRELVDGNLSIRADRASTITRGVVTINGKEVHLG
ncbi:MAG: DUF3540 domain-containing protein [Deltaproteobacteria bacterium]|jgi:hypothetical protein|nr:DUF3540 domain-containing protein [Deltaproteobacteria bacterium]MBW2531479.1 DUF3540 domain-containing protein [Deltaproteobacteria bacterium]